MKKQYVRGVEAIPEEARNCVLTIGNFDGVHVGHQRILMTCRAVAQERDTPVVAITFDPLPEAVLHPQAVVPQLIYPVGPNCELLLRKGADLVVIVPTTRELLSLTPHDFVHQLIMRHLSPQHIVEGADFFFGRGRAGNVVTLTELGVRHGFDVTVVSPVVLNLPEGERRVSSTLIRTLISEGRIEDANFCLGREFALNGTVVAGAGRGRLLDFPTANLDVRDQIVPADGVYAGWATLGEKKFVSAVSIGNKPTLGPSPRTVEAFLIDAEGDFYGQQMTLSLTHRIRDQRKFDNAEALKQQIAMDVEDVRKLLG